MNNIILTYLAYLVQKQQANINSLICGYTGGHEDKRS